MDSPKAKVKRVLRMHRGREMLEASVIIPTYNRAEILRCTLSSLAQQRYPRDRFEVIVVDDESTDHTAEVVREFQRALNLLYLYRGDSDHRVSRPRNLGIAKAQGEILLFLDSDMIVCPDYVEEHLTSHRISDTPLLVMGYVYGYRYGYEVDGRVLLERVDFRDVSNSSQVLRAHSKFWDPREIVYQKVDDDLSQLPAPWRFVWSNSISLRREEALRIGGFDDAFQALGGEDTEFGYRCFKKGLHFWINRKAWGVHYPHPIDVEMRKNASRHNVLLFYCTHPNPEIELYTVTHRYTYNRLLGQLQGVLGWDLLPDYGSLRFTKVWDALRLLASNRMLVLGGSESALIHALNPSVATDFDRDRVERVQRMFQNVDVQWAIGVQLLYPDRYFDRVVISDFWRALSRICVGRLLREAVRLGKEVFVLCTPDFKPPLPKGHLWHRSMVLPKLCRRLGLACTSISLDPMPLYQISPASR